jgi:hypothetical protein
MRSTLVAIALVLAFVLFNLHVPLATAPQVYEDEPWQASTAFKLETQGVFGSDLFAGFFHMDQRYYGFMPLHPLLEAGLFKVAGVGLAQARLETLLLSATSLLETFALGARLFDASVGALAVGLLMLVRWTGLTYVQLTGIPLEDFARIARYDPLVPVVGLAALHVYVSARSTRKLALYAAAGALAGLAGLAHVYGLFWVPALLILTVWDRAGKVTVAWITLAAVAVWLPYAAYVLADLSDWHGQTAIYAMRFDLLDPRWYLSNLLNEFHRYGPGLGRPGLDWLLRPGFWFLLLALPLSLLALARRAWSCKDDLAARTLVVPALLFPALFALVITLKLVNYTLIELPLFALAVAWGVRALWQRRRRLRPLLAAVGLVVGHEGGFALGQLDAAAATLTPYPTFVAEIRQSLPPGARVLGLHSYWLGLQDYDYRSFLVPLNFADLGVPLDQALDDVDPDVVLLDARMRAYFEGLPPGGDGQRFDDWLQRHSAQVIADFDDPTYGRMTIYRLSR